MFRKSIAWIVTLAMLVSLFPATAFAIPDLDNNRIPTATQAIYVDSEGNDQSGNGSEAKPYATLAKAVSAVSEEAATIYVMSNLEMTESARFWNKHITITSGDGGPYTVSRGDGMAQVQDNARSTYNPAMIEANGNAGQKCASLTLKNIVLDDGGKKVGTYYVQAASNNGGQTTVSYENKKGEKVTETIANTEIVQDAMIATYNGVAEIILDEGAVLRNYGGMSAVRVSGGTLTMKDGSVIEDTTVSEREKGEQGSFGPAGAVWLQGGDAIVEAGAIIQNIIGRAVYADGGQAIVGGTIRNIKGDGHMWQGAAGTALHLRNSAHAAVSGSIDGCTKGVNIEVIESTLTMTEASVLKNGKDAINISSSEKVQLNGEITGFTGGGHVLNMQGVGAPMNCTIGATGNIHDNACSYGVIYIQAPHGKLDIYGKINHNTTADRAGAIALAHNFRGHVVTMYDGAEMNGNSSTETGGAVMVSGGTFVMEGGTIEGNHAAHEGGGIYIRNGGQFVMKGGVITGNTSDKIGGGVAFLATDWGDNTDTHMVPYCDLQGGTISDNIDKNGSNDVAVLGSGSGHNSRYFKVGKNMNIETTNLYFEKGGMTFRKPMRDVKYGNASDASEKALEKAMSEKNLPTKIASFWFNSGERPLPLTVSLPADKVIAEKSVYAAVVPTDADGNPAPDAVVDLFAVTKAKDGTYRVALPGAADSKHATGFAVMFVQEGITPSNILTITPANTIVYTEAVIGHDGVVGEDGSIHKSNLPEPGFYIEGLEDGQNPEDIVFVGSKKDGANSWKVESYDGKSNRVFRIVPIATEQQAPLRLTFTDEEGTEHINSDFDVSESTYDNLFINLYRGNDGPVTAKIGDISYDVIGGTGLLTIRAVSDEVDVVEVQTEPPTATVDQATAVVPEGVYFTINGGDVQVTERGPALLSDYIAAESYDDYGKAWNEAMVRRVDKELGGSSSTRQHDFMYLDFVDAANGRLWLTPSDDVEIYFPYPEGTDQNTDFTFMRFKGLYRGAEVEDVAGLIDNSEVQTYEDSFETTPQGIKFRGNILGLFAVAWDKGGGTGTGGGTTTTRYIIDADAGEGGTISPSGRVKVARGSDKTFTIQADEGYKIANVLVDGQSVGAVSQYIFDNVRQKHTIEAIFTKQGDLPDENETGVSQWLDTKNHDAYLYGYPNGHFGTNNTMSRAEVAQMFYNLLLVKSVPMTTTFKDVKDDAWYAEAVHTLASLGMIKGIGNEQFAPTRAISRAEFSAMALRFASLEATGEDTFSDVVPTDWFYDAVLSASAYGWVVGFEDGTFRPQQTITRAEVTAIVNRMLGRNGDSAYIDSNLSELKSFPDAPKNHWAFYTIMEATNSHTYHKENGKESWTALKDE